MTDHEPKDDDAERVRRTAAAWIARIERGTSPSLQRKLDRWIAADPSHAVAYRRLSRHFDGARALRTSRLYADRPRPIRRPRPASIVATALAAGAAALLILPNVPLPWSRVQQPAPHRAIVAANGRTVGVRQLVAPSGAIKSVGLEDGSVITLDTASAVEVAFASATRQITLLRGRARFTVAHDGRPFTVLAGGGSVTARGTIFDVSLATPAQVGVVLLRGIVDVVPSSGATAVGPSPARRLRPGESIDFGRGAVIPRSGGDRVVDRRWADGAVDFDNVSLGYLLDTTNRGTDTLILIGDPSMATLRVSGRFELHDPARLAKNLASLFDLHADARADAIVLRRD